MRLSISKDISVALSCAIAVTLSLWGSPTLAGDPFRTSNSRAIGNNTQAAFEALFREGDYQATRRYLIAAEENEADEPLAHAMRASLGYLERDWETLKVYAIKTLHSAENLSSQDPLRGNLYLAVGHFLEGAYNFKIKEDTLGAISKLQKVLYYFDEAEDNAPNDPELNLLKGYLELLLAVNLPFSDPEKAISDLKEYAAPGYLVDRGIAVAYRDLKQYDKALEFINRAMEATPGNPELAYLKGHIIRHQSKLAESDAENLAFLEQALVYFDLAMVKAEQLPESVLKPIKREHSKTVKKIEELTLSRGSDETLLPAIEELLDN